MLFEIIVRSFESENDFLAEYFSNDNFPRLSTTCCHLTGNFFILLM